MEAPGTLHQAPGIREAGAGAGGASHAQSVTFPTSMLLKATPLKQIIIQFDSICPTLETRTAPFHRIKKKRILNVVGTDKLLLIVFRVRVPEPKSLVSTRPQVEQSAGVQKTSSTGQPQTDAMSNSRGGHVR